MIHVPFEEVEWQHLERLVADQTSENYRLEFKRQLGLRTSAQKHELAKDASALANTDGGRIVFGIAERELEDGSRCAGELVGVEQIDEEAILHVIASRTGPPVNARVRTIREETGARSAIMLEVPSSLGVDLHQVTGSQGGRYYRRGDKGVVRLSEPEIREAYARIAQTRTILEQSLNTQREGLYNDRPNTQECVAVIPWYGRPDLVRPQDFTPLRQAVAGAGRILNGYGDVLNFRTDGRGLHTPLDDHLSCMIRITKYGAVGVSDTNILAPQADNPRVYWPSYSLRMIIGALRVAKEVQESVGYYGLSEVSHRVLLAGEYRLGGAAMIRFPEEGHFKARTVRVLEENPLEVARFLMDETYHHAGFQRCNMFAENGELLGNAARELNQFL